MERIARRYFIELHKFYCEWAWGMRDQFCTRLKIRQIDSMEVGSDFSTRVERIDSTMRRMCNCFLFSVHRIGQANGADWHAAGDSRPNGNELFRRERVGP